MQPKKKKKKETRRDINETLKLRDTRLHKPKIRKYKNDSNTLEYGLYLAKLLK